MGWESSDVDKFNPGPFLQVQLRIAKVNSAYICLLLVLEFCNVKPTCWKSWDGNLLICSDLTWVPPIRSNRDRQI